jgi:nucleoside-diphosphate-sugar epimerase
LEDVCDALIAASTHDTVGTFNVASGKGISVRTTAETILELMQSRVPIESTGTTRKDEISKMSGDAEAIRRALGWRPRHDFRAGLEKTIAWFSAHAALAPQLD